MDTSQIRFQGMTGTPSALVLCGPPVTGMLVSLKLLEMAIGDARKRYLAGGRV